jgi:hypothetical protein
MTEELDFSQLKTLAGQLKDFAAAMNSGLQILAGTQAAEAALADTNKKLETTRGSLSTYQQKAKDAQQEYTAQMVQANEQRTQAQVDLQALAAAMEAKKEELAGVQATLDSFRAKLSA